MTVSEIAIEGGRLVFDVDGPDVASTCLLLHSLGTTSDLWAPQVEALSRRYRVIRYDVRGHGRSQPPVGPYTLEQLGADALAVLDAVGVERAHLCGVSLGGLTAQWLGVHAPDRVGRIVAANTAARLGSREAWAERIDLVRGRGMDAVIEGGIARWFTPRFQQASPDTVDHFRAMLRSCPVEGYAGSCAVLRDADLREEISRIAAPTLVVTGTHDTATPPALGELVAARVPHARAIELDAAHLSNVEQADAFTTAVRDFLGQPGSPSHH